MSNYKELYCDLYNAVEDSMQIMTRSEFAAYETMNALMETMGKLVQAQSELKKYHVRTQEMLKEMMAVGE